MYQFPFCTLVAEITDVAEDVASKNKDSGALETSAFPKNADSIVEATDCAMFLLNAASIDAF
jgi:hypothetical protein